MLTLKHVKPFTTRNLVIILFFLIVFSACREKPSKNGTKEPEDPTSSLPSQYIDIAIGETQNEDLSTVNKGGITCVVTLIDNTTESWPFKVLKGESTISGQSEETDDAEFIELDPGSYSVVFPFTNIEFPPIKDVKIEKGYITKVVLNLSSRFTITAMKKDRSIRIFNTNYGKDIGKSSHDFGKYESVVYDCLPGTYKLVYVYTEEKLEDIIFEVNEGETIDIKLE